MNATRRVTANLPIALLDDACRVTGRGITETLVAGLSLVKRTAAASKAARCGVGCTSTSTSRSRVSALVVDTSSWIAWLAGGGSPLVAEALEEATGAPAGRRRGRAAERATRRCRSAPSSRTCSPICHPWARSLDHWFRVGRLRADLRVRGAVGVHARRARRTVRARCRRLAADRRPCVRADRRGRAAAPRRSRRSTRRLSRRGCRRQRRCSAQRRRRREWSSNAIPPSPLRLAQCPLRCCGGKLRPDPRAEPSRSRAACCRTGCASSAASPS